MESAWQPGSLARRFFFVNDSSDHRYRPNVAAVVLNAAGQILLGERMRWRDSWQFPQGGLDGDESPEEGLRRELREEISLEPADYVVEARCGPYRYLFPAGWTKKGYDGQEQHYFRLRLLASESKVNVHTAHPEFRAARWIDPAKYSLAWLPEMKHAVYREVFREFFGLEIA